MSEKKKRILIVDDDRTNINVIGTMLQQDYEISVALSGAQALQLASSGLLLAMILLDVQMPDMSGIEVAKAIRAAPQHYGGTVQVPILAITGSMHSETHDTCKNAGMNGVFLKPVSQSTLKAEIARWLT